MYTVVSLTVDLAGEPDTIDFTLALFGSIFLLLWIFAIWRLVTRSVLTPKTLTFHTLTHNGGENRVFCALFPNGVKLRRCSLSWYPFSFVSQSSSSGNPSLHGSMSSSADFSDEDDYSVKSGSASPAPGDTLPWNLPRHERSKRKIHGGSVLDPAERAVLRIAGETQSYILYYRM